MTNSSPQKQRAVFVGSARAAFLHPSSVAKIMWRAFFFAVGLFTLIVGVQCLLVDSVTWAQGVVEEPAPPPQPQQQSLFGQTPPPAAPVPTGGGVYRPSESLPWSLMAVGTLVMLYSSAISRNRG